MSIGCTAPVPDDVEVVEALVIDVVGPRLQRRLVLGGHEVLSRLLASNVVLMSTP